MKKKRKLCFYIIFMLILIVIVPSLKVNAVEMTPVFPYKLTWNIEKIYYFIDGSAPGYTGTIKAAAYNWVKTGYGRNKLYPNTQTTNKTLSAVDFFAEDHFADTYLAYTIMLKKLNGMPIDVDPDVENWSYAEIHINNTDFEKLDFNNRQGTIAHEFGHAWGLRDYNENQYSIMCQYHAGRKVYTVQQVDNNAFNSKY